ncbi:MAG: hypothetical protein JNL51_11470 [Chitinophagaceae bacterium]|nr:hypothetical protein [Chitinophagaceae bacterium]
MSLKDLQLNNIMIAGLYRNVLVAPENDTDARPRQTAKEQLSVREQAVHDTQEISKSTANNVLQQTIAETENISQPVMAQDGKNAREAGRETENILQEADRQTANISQPAGEQAENKMEKNEAEPIRFLGNNHSHILILASDTQHAFLPEEHLALLIKMLEACKLNTGDTAIVNLATRPLTYPQLKDQLRPQKALFFGVGPDAIKMPVESALFHIGSFDDCLYVCAPSLGELNGNFAEAKALKARLWTSLQQLFLQKNPVPDA